MARDDMTRAADEADRTAGKKAVGKTSKKSAKKAARKASKKSAKKTAKKARKKAVGKTSAAGDLPDDGRRRVVIEGLSPVVDAGRFDAKRIAGEPVVVEADAFTDGHDALAVVLLHRAEGEDGWTETPMEPMGNDRWRGAFPAPAPGRYLFTVEAWVDDYATWRQDLVKRLAAGQEVAVPLEIGARLVDEAAGRAAAAGHDDDADALRAAAERLRAEAAAEVEAGQDRESDAATAGRDTAPAAAHGTDPAFPVAPGVVDHPGLDPELATLVARWPDRRFATRHAGAMPVWADRQLARFGAWYEFFPRSTGPAGEHGTFETAKERLRYVADLGFDVVYLPPVHPIGRTKRKGPNNAVEADPGDPGSPWAIGAAEGGHKAVHPDLGTLEDFRAFRREAERLGLEVALDVAFQCAPDHPYVTEHPEWFRHRPDGSIQFAENPPKKYEDIVPFDFETDDWRALWEELKSVFDFWVEQGVTVFRVDNPHTKPFAFWEWAIAEIRKEHPEAIFLSEAFTRPKVMYRLAKLGFTQSYTYFAWRNAKWEIERYVTELTRAPTRDFFRPNFWPNTPDILTERLQTGGRPAFVSRVVLAATLSSSYGIYGPAYELLASEPREPGSEEYLDSEKYEVRDWELGRPDSIRDVLRRLNRIRRDNPALHRTEGVTFHRTDNDLLIAYSKRTDDGANALLVVVNLDPHHTQSGWLELDPGALDLAAEEAYQVHDLLGGARYHWHGARNYVELDPRAMPAHVFRIARRVRTERDFDYFL